ncbi:hypothetical protein THAOC_21380, partial [Thalassiosira oceanica]
HRNRRQETTWMDAVSSQSWLQRGCERETLLALAAQWTTPLPSSGFSHCRPTVGTDERGDGYRQGRYLLPSCQAAKLLRTVRVSGCPWPVVRAVLPHASCPLPARPPAGPKQCKTNPSAFFDEGLDGSGQIVAVAGGLDANCYLADTSVERINGPDRWNLNHRKVVRYDDSFGDRLEREAGHGSYVSGILSGRRSKGTDDNESAGHADGAAPRLAFFDMEAGLRVCGSSTRAGAGRTGDGTRRSAARSTQVEVDASRPPLRAERREHGAGERGLEHTEPGRLQELARSGRDFESGERRAERREGRGVPGGLLLESAGADGRDGRGGGVRRRDAAERPGWLLWW